jgi:hypothetical protein
MEGEAAGCWSAAGRLTLEGQMHGQLQEARTAEGVLDDPQATLSEAEWKAVR